jgi:hypothetical protein
VLEAGHDALTLKPQREGTSVAHDFLRLARKRAIADHWILGIRVHVRDRREIQIETQRQQLTTKFRRDTLRELGFVTPS